MKSVLVFMLLLAFHLSCPAQSQTTWDGFVTDTHCGTNCQRTTDMKPDRACVRRCVRKGSKYGLWYGNRVYDLEPQTKAAGFAAEKVHISGTMVNGTIRIEAIALRGR